MALNGRAPNQDLEGLRMNVRSLLRRVESLAGRRCTLHVEGRHEELVAAEARAGGWTIAVPEEAQAAIRFSPGEPAEDGTISQANAGIVVWVGQRAQTGFDLATGAYRLAVQRRYQSYYSLNRIFSHFGGFLPIPDGLRRWVANLWERMGLSERTGARMAALPLGDDVEAYWVRGGESDAGGMRLGGPGLKDRCYDALASFGGTGHVPLVGAAVASLVTMVLALPTWQVLAGRPEDFRAIWAIVTLLATLGCVVTEKWAQRYYLAEDPREVVLDETAGMALTLTFIPSSLWEEAWVWGALIMVVAFFAFRFFDMFKVGVRWVEKRGWRGTIVWDDLLAGLYAGVVTWIAGTALVWVT